MRGALEPSSLNKRSRCAPTGALVATSTRNRPLFVSVVKFTPGKFHHFGRPGFEFAGEVTSLVEERNYRWKMFDGWWFGAREGRRKGGQEQNRGAEL